MIRQIWINFVTSYRQFEGTGAILVLFAVSLCLLIITYIRKGKGINPAIFFGFIATVAGGFAEFFYAVFDKKYEKKSYKVWSCILALILIVFATALSGKRVFSRNHLEKSDNQMHLPASVLEVSDMILADNAEGPVRIFPGPCIGDEFTAYSSRFVCAYEENYGDLSKYDEKVREAYSELGDVHPDMEAVRDAALENDCRYVIIKSGLWPEIPLDNYGFNLYWQNEDLSVYEYAGEEDAP